MSFYTFWVSQQTIPGNVLPDIVIGGATYIIGKYKVAPWLHARHTEHLEQKERQHQEQVDCHKALFALHEKHHQELLDQHRQLLEATQAGATFAPTEPVVTTPAPRATGSSDPAADGSSPSG
jgi:hypothetical protein